MFEVAIADIFLKAFILCGLLYLFAKHEADYDFAKVAMVTAGILFGGFIIQMTLVSHIGKFTLIPVGGFVVWMLMQFCWLSLPKALIVTAAFTLATIGVDFAKVALFGGMEKKIEEDGNTTRQLLDKQDEEGMQAIRDINEGTARMEGGDRRPAAAAAPAPKPAAGTNVIVKTVKTINYSDEGGYSGTVVTNRVAVTVDWIAAKARLAVTARMTGKDKQMLAVVNGQMVKVGALVTIEHEGLKYSWRLKSLTKDTDVWEPVSVAAAE